MLNNYINEINTFVKSNFSVKDINLQKILNNFIFFLVLIYLIPKTIYSLPEISLDPSWRISVNLAVKENLVFGKDYIYTIGPLGYLITGLPYYTSGLLVALFYFFFVGNGVYFIYYLFKLIEKKNELILISITCIICGWFLFWKDSLLLYFYFTFHIFHFLKHRNLSSLVIASICGLLAFYIKINAGIVVNVMFIFFIIYNFFFKTLDKKINILFLVVHLLALYFLSFLLNTDFFHYLSNSMPMINSYNDAMVIPPLRYQIYTASLIILAILVTTMISINRLINSHNDLFLFFNLSLLSFVLLKEGFVRADGGHVNIFFSGICFLVFFIPLFSESEKVRTDFYNCVVITAILGIVSLRDYPMQQSLIDSTKATLSQLKGFSLQSFLFPPTDENIIYKNKQYRKLPEKVIKEIGNKTVDVLGWEISYIFYNNLRYNPRPIIQSFSAYDKKFIDLNYEKYNSDSAPDYVLYHYASLDDRNGFWEEPKIFLALLKNYDVIDTIPATKDSDALLLFKKTTKKREIVEKVVMDKIINFNTKFVIPHSDNILFLTLDYDYTLLGKIRRTLFQPSLVFINMVYNDKEVAFNRLIKPVMQSGIPINKKVRNLFEARTFFTSNGKKNEDAKSLELQGTTKYVKDSFKARLVEYKIVEK
jgi:hypothetical protein